MVINIIGDCDKRAVLYTFIKIFQTLGDVLVVSSSSRLLRLSDTHESGGHYQNTMVCVTHDGLDDFFAEFGYAPGDFEFIIIDNIVAPDADLYFYVEGLEQSEREQDFLEYIEKYYTIPLYKKKLLDKDAVYKMEQFEAYKDLCPISKTLANELCKLIAPTMNTTTDNLLKIALAYPTGNKGGKPEKKGQGSAVSKLPKIGGIRK